MSTSRLRIVAGTAFASTLTAAALLGAAAPAGRHQVVGQEDRATAQPTC